jgi:hypothetical protein
MKIRNNSSAIFSIKTGSSLVQLAPWSTTTISNSYYDEVMTQAKKFDFLFVDSLTDQTGLDLTLTFGQVRSLNTIPVTLIPAPSQAGKVLVVTGIYASLQYNSAAYVSSDKIEIRYQNQTGQLIAEFSNSFLTSASSALRFLPLANELILTKDVPIIVTSASNPTIGNSSIKLRVYYRTEVI